MSNITAKRTPDAPRTVAEAIGDVDNLQELLKELDDSTLVQSLVKAGSKSQLVQAYYWSCRSGVTEEHLNQAIKNQEAILAAIEAWKQTGLPDSTPLAAAQEVLEAQGKTFDLGGVTFLIEEATRGLATVEAIKVPVTISSIYGPNVVMCGKCGLVPGTQRCGRCKTRFYCSPPCQKGDWPTHKTHCKPQ